MSAPFSFYDYDNWKRLILDSGINDDIKKIGIDYLKHCENKQLPFLLAFEQFGFIFSIDIKVLSTISRFPESYYRHFTIPKRTGGTRNISAPYPVLYMIQRWILENILNKVEINSSTYAFVRGKSIVGHANIHKAEKYLLKIDLKDFFPSINLKRIFQTFKEIGFPYKVALSLARFCSLNYCLPQGAPTSPALSNIIAQRLDKRIFSLCKKYSYNYSRYADDIAISGEYINTNFITIINRIVNSEGFQINNDKTQLIAPGKKKILTGISISNGELTIPRQKKRELRAAANKLLKSNPIDYIINSGDPLFLDRIIGHFSFWKQIEPKNQYINSTIEKLYLLNKGINNSET